MGLIAMQKFTFYTLAATSVYGGSAALAVWVLVKFVEQFH